MGGKVCGHILDMLQRAVIVRKQKGISGNNNGE